MPTLGGTDAQLLQIVSEAAEASIQDVISIMQKIDCPYRKLDLGKIGKVRERRRANHSGFLSMIASLAAKQARCHLLGRGGSC